MSYRPEYQSDVLHFSKLEGPSMVDIVYESLRNVLRHPKNVSLLSNGKHKVSFL
jgi:hypothetical protein